MRFEVPQFIEVEDKIFGPLTWRQFAYLGGGLGIAAALFLSMPIIIFLIFGLPIALLGAALSFYPVNNRAFSFFLESFLSYLAGPKLYLWRRKEEAVYKEPALGGNEPAIIHEPIIRSSGKNISSLARRLELQAIQKTE
jgi:hypothetical protein